MVFFSFFREPSAEAREKVASDARLARPNYPPECFGLTAALPLADATPLGDGNSTLPPPPSAQLQPIAGKQEDARIASAFRPALSAAAGNGGRPVINLGRLAVPGFGSFLWMRSRVRVGHGRADFENCRDALQNWRQFSLPWTQLSPATPIHEPGRRLSIAANSLFAWTVSPLKIFYVVNHHDSKGTSAGGGGSKKGSSGGARTPRGGGRDRSNSRSPRASRKSGGSETSWDEAAVSAPPEQQWSRLPAFCRSRFAVAVQTLQGHLLAGEERFSVDWLENDDVVFEIQSFSKPAHFLSTIAYPYVVLQQLRFAKEGSKAVSSFIQERKDNSPKQK